MQLTQYFVSGPASARVRRSRTVSWRDRKDPKVFVRFRLAVPRSEMHAIATEAFRPRLLSGMRRHRTTAFEQRQRAGMGREQEMPNAAAFDRTSHYWRLAVRLTP